MLYSSVFQMYLSKSDMNGVHRESITYLKREQQSLSMIKA